MARLLPPAPRRLTLHHPRHRRHLLVEGNYLLYDAHPWNTLAPLADLTVFLDAEKPLLRRRLIQRKMAGGLSRDEAQRFYERSDARNVDLVLDCHLPADVTLHL